MATAKKTPAKKAAVKKAPAPKAGAPAVARAITNSRRMKFHVVGGAKEWHWTLHGGNGKQIIGKQGPFASKQAAVNACDNLTFNLVSASIAVNGIELKADE